MRSLFLAAALLVSASAAAQPALKMMIPANPGGGWAQFVNASKGDPNAVMVGGILLNKSPVSLSQVTPIARLTSEWEVIVVPAQSPHQSLADLLKAFRENPGKVSWGGGSAGGTAT